MNLTRTRLLKLFGILILSVALVIIPVRIFATTQKIRVDVDRVLSDVSNNPVGIGLNFAGDSLDATEALKDLKVKTLRYATNEFYLFDEEQPDRPKVSVRDFNNSIVKGFAESDGTWWSRLNFDDFMSICQSIDAEPFVVIAIDAIAYHGDAPHATPEEVLRGAVEWVRYANITKGYNVKYWEIGNESDLSPEPVNWTPEKYAETVVKFSQAMKAVDPTIKIGANGMPFGEVDWWGRVMPIVKNSADFLVTHQYSWLENYQEWKDDPWEYDTMLVNAQKAIQTYNPALKLDVTENSSFNTNTSISHANNTWKMLHNFEMLGQTLRFKEVNRIHFWTSRWLEEEASSHDFSAFDSNYKLMPMGYPIKVWNSFLKNKMVFSTKQAGTIRSWASYTPEDNSLSVFLLNKDRIAKKTSIILNNYKGSSRNERWILKGPAPDSKNIAFKKLSPVSLKGGKIDTKLEPLSVTIISFDNNISN